MYDYTISFTFAAGGAWLAFAVGVPHQGQIAAALLSQVAWLAWRSF